MYPAQEVHQMPRLSFPKRHYHVLEDNGYNEEYSAQTFSNKVQVQRAARNQALLYASYYKLPKPVGTLKHGWTFPHRGLTPEHTFTYQSCSMASCQVPDSPSLEDLAPVETGP